jgi:hypothetical protein
MSPQQGDSGGTIRLQLLDGRQIPVWLGREELQLYYGGARRDEASERAELATLAKLVALEPGPAGPRREPKTKEDLKDTASVYRQGAHLYVGMQEAREAGADDDLEAVKRAVAADPTVLENAGSDAMQAAARMPFVEDVLRRYHPDFCDRPREERIDLLIQGSQHVDPAWRALDALREFVQSGSQEGREKRKSPDPQLDVRAAELKEALGLTHREIGKILHVPRTQTDVHQGGHRRVGHIIERGRRLLIENLGEAGYSAHIEDVRADLRRRHALSDRDRLLLRLTEITAQLPGRSLEEAEALRSDFEHLVDKHFSRED